jgi:O-antigen ligase
MISIPLIIITIVIYLRLNRFHQFMVFSFAALYPFTFGDLRSIPSLLIIEWLTIVTFISLINELISVNSINKGLKKIKFKGVGIFIFAFVILVFWLIISFINNEILAQQIITADTVGTKRTYFDIINNILLVFTTIVFVTTHFEKINVEKFLKAILYVSLIIGFIRIFTFYFQMETPLLTGLFEYNSKEMITYSGVSYRFSGLDYVAEIGVPALFGLYIYKNKLNLFALVLMLIFVFLSGGRTIMIGVIVAIVLFSFLLLPKNFIYLIIGAGLMAAIAIIFLPHNFLEGQITRLSDLKENKFMGQDAWRGMAWYLYLKSFAAHPIFGKGIGNYSSFIYSPIPGTEDFARTQMLSGGHGSYFSLLGILGLGGITYFLITMFGGIILAYRKIKQYVSVNIDKAAIAIFSFMLLIILSIDCITGHNGLDIPFFFYTIGLICSLRVLDNNESEFDGELDEIDSKELEISKHV